MTEQTPHVVAAVDVSPVSPKPIHTSATSPALVPSLQDHAATLDVAYLDSLSTAPFPFVTMPSSHPPHPANGSAANTVPDFQSSPAQAPDSAVVRGDEDDRLDESQDEDNAVDEESLDAYGEDDDNQQLDLEAPQSSSVQQEHIGESSTGTGTTDVSEPEPSVAQPDVTEASSESMTNTPSTTSFPVSNTVMKSEPTSAVSPDPAKSEGAIVSVDRPADPPAPEGPTQAKPHTIVASSAATSNEPAPADAAAVEQQQDPIAVDIQKLVSDIAAANAAASSPATATTSQAPAEAASSAVKPESSSISLPQSSSLPPKPVVPRQAGQPGSRPEDFHPFQSRGANNSHGAPTPMQGVVHSQAAPNGSAPYMGTAGPGTAPAAMSSLPPIPPSPLNSGPQPYSSLPNVASASGYSSAERVGLHGAQLQAAWETFQDDEKRYLTEAKWERFPENSRIFIGNLSSERVSKREVFDVFHRFGRLAQISLKSAYGFVQYHSAEDAEAAMQSAQGAELGGRKIHLEFSRVQKKKDPQERELRDRSPDRRNQRGGGGGLARGNLDRYDGRDRDQNRRRDDYRGGRSPSPRRDESYGRGGRDQYRSGPYDRNPRPRSRSRSPRSGRQGQDFYRRRSPSPRKRGPPDPSLDMPRRYGDQVPDVQILLLEQLQPDFVTWVQRALFERGLKADVMYFNPSKASREAALQKLVVEGVHGLIELDSRAQMSSKIPLQVFARSGGNSVRYDQYQDLDPNIAAELVLRAKQPHAPPPQLQQQPAYTGYPPNTYSQYQQPYPPQQGLPQGPPPAGYPYAQPPPPVAPQTPAAGLTAQDIASLAGKVDNNTLQALLSSLSANQQAQAQAQAPQQPGRGVPAAQHPGIPPQFDNNALVGSRHGGAPPAQQPQASAYGMPSAGGYMPPYMTGTPAAAGQWQQPPPSFGGAGGPDTAAQVQNIMDSLARQR